MVDESSWFFGGFITGGVIFWVVFAIILNIMNDANQSPLTACAQQHNVFECEYIAVPKENSK
jgi:hypothetical protein